MKTLEEASQISEQDKRLLLELKARIRRILPTATVLLYGSVARGESDPESDYDVLIIAEDPVPKSAETSVEDLVWELELERGVVLSTLYQTRERWEEPRMRVSPLHREVDRDAVVL